MNWIALCVAYSLASPSIEGGSAATIGKEYALYLSETPVPLIQVLTGLLVVEFLYMAVS